MGNRILAGRYDLMEKIGEGGMSVVFRAQDRVLSRFVAVKILRPEYTRDQQFIESFRKESQLAAGIVDPNIVNVYDVGREGNIYYIVMELVEGLPLSEIIKYQGALEPRRAVNITRQIAMALSTAHKHNLIHRDVKPHNILIGKNDVAKIADFGIAKVVSNDTLVGDQKEAVMGSIHYFSPEQARGNRVDERSDIYSLGIVLYEMVTGKVPFDGQTAVEVAVKHLNEKMVPPSHLNPDIPQDLEDVILRATSKNPDHRYKNADEMITDLSFIKFSRHSDYAQEKHDDDESDDAASEFVESDIMSEEEESNGREDKVKSKTKKNKSKSKWSGDRTKKLIAIIAAVVIAVPLSALIFNKYLNPDNKVPTEVELPSFVGMTQEDALEAAQKYDLELAVDLEIPNDDYLVGQIFSQSPDAGTVVKRGSTVKINISTGFASGNVPSVKGKSQTSSRPNAKQVIESYSFELGKVSYEYSDTIPSGYVISQSPEGGATADVGSKIDIVVSKGPKDGTAKTDNKGGSTTQNASGTDIKSTSSGISLSSDGEYITFVIESGTKVSEMGEILCDAGLVPSKQEFVDKVNELDLATKMRAGTYKVLITSTLEDIVKTIAHVK